MPQEARSSGQQRPAWAALLSGRHGVAPAGRVVCVLCLAGLGAFACADLLGIPDEPHLTENQAEPGPTAPATEAAMATVNGAGSDVSGTSETDDTPPDALGPSAPGAVPTSNGSALDARDAGDTGNGADAASTPACEPAEVLGPDGNCYVVVATLQTWVGARLDCLGRGDGWDLAALRDEAIASLVAPLITGETWIGAADFASEGAWVWVRDGSAFWNGDETGSAVAGEYTNWNQTEPNGGVDSNCA